MGGGSQKPQYLKECMGLNWNFQRGGGIQTKKSSLGQLEQHIGNSMEEGGGGGGGGGSQRAKNLKQCM